MAELISTGEFHLDPRRAREKLREFQLESPDHYVLELVKVAHILNADTIELQLEGPEVIARLRGATIPADQLPRIYSAAFSPRQTPLSLALRHLAMALYALEGAGCRRIHVSSGGDAPGAVLLDDDAIEVLPPPSDQPPAVTLRAERGIADRLSRFFSRITSPSGSQELHLLKERASFSSIPITVNGKPITSVFFLHGMPQVDRYELVRRFDAPDHGEQAIVGLAARTRDEARHQVHVLQYGVLLHSSLRLSPLPEYNVHSLIQTTALATNISQSAFVMDGRWRELQQRMDSRIVFTISDLFTSRADQAEWLQARSTRHLVSKALQLCTLTNTSAPGALIEVLDELPFLRRLDRETRTMGSPISPAEARVDDTIYFVTQGARILDELPDDVPIVWWQNYSVVLGSCQITEARALLRHFAKNLEVLHWEGAQGTPHLSRIKLEPWEDLDEGNDLAWLFDSSVAPEEEPPRRTLAQPNLNLSRDVVALADAFLKKKKEEVDGASTPEAQIARWGSDPEDPPITWSNGDGSTALRLVGDTLEADRDFPAFQRSLQHPEDTFALASAAALLYSARRSLHADNSNPVLQAQEKRRHLKRLTRDLIRRSP